MPSSALVWNEVQKHFEVEITNRKGETKRFACEAAELSADLPEALTDEAITVEFERNLYGKPIKIRRQGGQFVARSVPSRVMTQPQPKPPSAPGDFHNPYNFIPAPPRPKTRTDLDDHAPMDHDRYHREHWSGTIRVKMTSFTPLLIPDAARTEVLKRTPKGMTVPAENRGVEVEGDHKVYGVQTDPSGRPIIPSTSIKGMLRSAFEAVTNSRMSVFQKHGDRLAYRMAAKVGPVPARVESDGKQLRFRVMQPADLKNIGYAARLRRYKDKRDLDGKDRENKDKGLSRCAKPFDGMDLKDENALPKHGEKVWVKIYNGYCTNIKLRKSDDEGDGEWRAGWVFTTGPNINGKLHERVFIRGTNDGFVPVNDRHRQLWQELIQNYRETHTRDLAQRKGDDKPWDYLGNTPGKTAWSRQVFEDNYDQLVEGRFCYLEFAPGSETEITAIIPVSISRRLFAASPDALLPDSLKPASSLDQLSPADRVFGWVNQSPNGKGTYRGSLRLGAARCNSAEAIEKFEFPGIPLSILGQPKPQQSRFYVAALTNGDAQQNGISREEAGYWPYKGLRGRKVYPHHAGLSQEHWTGAGTDLTQQMVNGHYQEYRRPFPAKLTSDKRPILNNAKYGFELNYHDAKSLRDDQNRSITSWIRAGAEFDFDLTIENLSDVELGALLWLLQLGEGNYHRLGGGKPLGFGSVGLSVDWSASVLSAGENVCRRYQKLDETPLDELDEARKAVGKYTESVGLGYGSGDFERASFIKAFRRYVQGFTKPVHYPRALQSGQQRDGSNTIPPNPEGKSFEWFVANERTGRDGGPKLALSDLETDEGLPVLTAR